MTLDEIKTKVVEFVEAVQGCKATEICAVPDIVLACTDHPLPELLEELVQEGRLLEVEYTVPNLEFRLKSFLLPAGSKVTQVRCGPGGFSLGYGDAGAPVCPDCKRDAELEGLDSQRLRADGD